MQLEFRYNRRYFLLRLLILHLQSDMFKTVKVGNTSLQYAIVSQSEESSAAPCPTVNKSKLKRKSRHRKTVILILITLIVGCGIVIAAVLVPILVASKLVGSLPESAKFQTFAIAASSIQGYGKHDQNGHKYVELLPIKQAPVDAVIEFQDEIPAIRNGNIVWSPDLKLNSKQEPNLIGGDDADIRSTESTTNVIKIDHKNFVSNSSEVTVYYSKTENVTTLPQHDEFLTRSSKWFWHTVSRFIGNLITLLIKKKSTVAISVSFLLVFVMLVGVIKYRKRRSRPEKVETYEQEAQRKQLLSAIPIEDD